MQRVDPKKFQIFDLLVLRKWPMAKVVDALKVNRATVYLAKHRISKLIKAEVRILESQLLNDPLHTSERIKL